MLRYSDCFPDGEDDEQDRGNYDHITYPYTDILPRSEFLFDIFRLGIWYGYRVDYADGIGSCLAQPFDLLLPPVTLDEPCPLHTFQTDAVLCHRCRIDLSHYCHLLVDDTISLTECVCSVVYFRMRFGYRDVLRGGTTRKAAYNDTPQQTADDDSRGYRRDEHYYMVYFTHISYF